MELEASERPTSNQLGIAITTYVATPQRLPYGPPKTLYNRFIRWSRLGVFDRIFEALAAKGGKPDRLMIDATHLKAHRTAASLLKKGLFPAVSDGPKVA